MSFSAPPPPKSRFTGRSAAAWRRSPEDSPHSRRMPTFSTEAFDPIWGIRFAPDDEPVEVEWVNRSRDRRIDPAELWREIVGADPRLGPVRIARPRNHG